MMDHGPIRVTCGLQNSKSKLTLLKLMMVSSIHLSKTGLLSFSIYLWLIQENGKLILSKELVSNFKLILKMAMLSSMLFSKTQSNKMCLSSVTNIPLDFGHLQMTSNAMEKKVILKPTVLLPIIKNFMVLINKN